MRVRPRCLNTVGVCGGVCCQRHVCVYALGTTSVTPKVRLVKAAAGMVRVGEPVVGEQLLGSFSLSLLLLSLSPLVSFFTAIFFPSSIHCVQHVFDLTAVFLTPALKAE